MNTILNYTGKVKLFININNKSFEVDASNTGTITLMESICRFLSGQYRGTIDIPLYLDIRNSGSASVLVNLIPLSGRTFVSNGTDTVYTRCEATILYSSFSEPVEAQEGTNYTLVLCADPDPNLPTLGNRDLATVSLSSLVLSRITSGTSAALEWRLYIQNGSDS